jgi:PAS domain S-box-containing protein
MLGSKDGLKAVTLFFFAIIIIFIIGPFPNIYSVGYKIRYIGAFIGTATITYFVEYIRNSTQELLSKKNKELQNSLTQLDKKEQELSERETYYRTLFEKSNDAVFLMCNNTFVDCNNKALSLFGCSKNEILGKTPIELSPYAQPNGTISEEVATKKIDTALTGKHQNFEWVFKKFDGTIFYSEISLDKIEFNNRKSILASIRDISDRKLSEKALLKAKEKAERSERIKSDFLAQMSHEIRTPINTIMNYTYLLKTEFENQVSEDNSGSFNSIENAAGRLLRTIDLILNISDIEAGTYEPKIETIPIISKIIEPATNEFKQSAENKNLSLEIVNDINNNINVTVDSYTLYQTVANLIDNAIKYTNKGKVQVILKETENHICVKIKDTGIGISKEYIPHLFDKFSQEEVGYTRKFEGNGLGLALVKKYCAINNIEILIDSEKNVGTTFTLKIPQAA